MVEVVGDADLRPLCLGEGKLGRGEIFRRLLVIVYCELGGRISIFNSSTATFFNPR